MRRIIISCALLLVLFEQLTAIEIDTLRVYRLGEVNVKGMAERTVREATINKLSYRRLQNSDINSISEISNFLPSTTIRTNSRGESLLFIRGAGERQIGIFFDGASIHLPFDNRVDLQMIPTDIIGKIELDRNASSILYGANIMGGAMKIATIERASSGFGITARLGLADASTQSFSLVTDGRFNSLNYIANFSYIKSDGIILSNNKPDDLSNQNEGSSIVTNTDYERLTGYLRAEFKPFNNTSVGLSANIISADKGVASENYVPSDKARFWRYPEWKRNMLTLNAEQIFDEEGEFLLKATFWADKFEQEIHSFKDISYKVLKETQKDEDLTFGSRVALHYSISEGQNFTAVFNALTTGHKEKIDDKSQANEYAQNTISSGLEYGVRYGSFENKVGFVFDYNSTPKTGIFEAHQNQSVEDYAVFIQSQYKFDEQLSLNANISRRSRFPTLREAFSGALGKFLVNSQLKPETGILAELALNYEVGEHLIQISAFSNLQKDLIVRVAVPNDSLNRLMRDNLAEATITGAELFYQARDIYGIELNTHITLLFSKGKDENKNSIELEYKPKISAAITLRRAIIDRLFGQIELDYIGEQYAVNPYSTVDFDKVDPTLQCNFRLSYNYSNSTRYIWETYARLNNIFDVYRESQLGIPNAGRTFSLGIAFRI